MKNFKFILPILIISTILYTYKLERSPVHFNQDELGFSMNAYSIAKTGFDENGRFMPFYFWHLGLMWSTPIIVYLTSLILLVAPISEFTVRLSSVIVGLINISLIFGIALKIFKNKYWASLSAILMMLTPVHIIHSRVLLDNLYTVPFISGWFLLLLKFKESQKNYLIFLSTLLLGIGLHSYHAAKIIMPIFFVATIILLLKQINMQKKMLIPIFSGFIIPIIPLIFWLQKFPDTLTDQVKYVGLYNPKLSPFQGLLTLLNPETIINRLEIYVSYFSLDFLFFKGDSSLIHSTHTAGVFLLPFIILIPLGIYYSIKNRSWINYLILFGFFSAPFAASFVGNQFRISKSLTIIPFGVLLAVTSLKKIYENKNIYSKYVMYSFLVIILFQSVQFYKDYQGIYRTNSYSWYNYNIPDTLEKIIFENNSYPIQSIYLDQNIWFIDRYWKFYNLKKSTDLSEKTHLYEPTSSNIELFPINSILMYRFDHPPAGKSLTPTSVITEPDGKESYYVIKK